MFLGIIVSSQSLFYDFHLETGFNPAVVLQGRSLRACGPVFTHPLGFQIIVRLCILIFIPSQ